MRGDYFDEKPEIVHFAEQILDLYHENNALRREVEHYKELHKIHSDSVARSFKHTKELTGMMLNAVIDPDSGYNKMQTDALRFQLGETGKEGV